MAAGRFANRVIQGSSPLYSVSQMRWDDHCGRRATTGRLPPREVAPMARLMCKPL